MRMPVAGFQAEAVLVLEVGPVDVPLVVLLGPVGAGRVGEVVSGDGGGERVVQLPPLVGVEVEVHRVGTVADLQVPPAPEVRTESRYRTLTPSRRCSAPRAASRAPVAKPDGYECQCCRRRRTLMSSRSVETDLRSR